MRRKRRRRYRSTISRRFPRLVTWTPGYRAWNNLDYYLLPGTWVGLDARILGLCKTASTCSIKVIWGTSVFTAAFLTALVMAAPVNRSSADRAAWADELKGTDVIFDELVS